MRKIRAAVIGVGNMGRNHVRMLREMPECELVAVADADKSRAEAVGRIWEIESYSDWRLMLERQKPEFVVVAVPAHKHFEVASEVIGRNINLLVEKPLATSYQEGLRLLTLAKKNKVKLTVGYLERFNPAIVELKRRLARQDLGNIFSLHAKRLSPYPATVHKVGVTLDLATHDIDIFCYLLARPARSVFAQVQKRMQTVFDDWILGIIQFEGGVTGVLEVNWLTPTKIRQLLILGEKGMFMVDYITQDLYFFKNNFRKTSWQSLEVIRGVEEGEVVKLKIEKKEPLLVQMSAVVKNLLSGGEIANSADMTLESLLLAELLIKSGNSQRMIEVNNGKVG